MSDTLTLPIYDETATITTSNTFTSGSLFDIGVGLRVWRNLTVGVAYHQEQNDTDATITGSIPSPIFFDRPRQLSASESLDRKESAVHLVVGWILPFGPKFDVLVSGGPSFFRLNQDAVSKVTPDSQINTVAAAIEKTQRSKSVTGLNVGVDGTYILWSNDSIRIGAGGFFRFAKASTDVEMLATPQPTDVGGVQFGFGGRIRF